VIDFISNHLRAELDFLEESSNALQTSQFVESEPRLSRKVYIPKVYTALTTKKVLTAEWIDGVRLSDLSAIRRLMGEQDPNTNSPTTGTRSKSTYEHSGSPLRGGLKSIMQTMVSLFSAQMFSWGWVHCDPHPGNIIIRPSPSSPTEPQLVLLDHGLYVRLNEDLKRQYAELWRGLLGGDWVAIEDVTKEWGIGTPDLFASATLMRPVRYERKTNEGKKDSVNENDDNEEEKITEYERSVRLKRKLKGFLTDTDKMPKELIFLGRNMRMVQGLFIILMIAVSAGTHYSLKATTNLFPHP
jgi:aarF domain-containing kinase